MAPVPPFSRRVVLQSLPLLAGLSRCAPPQRTLVDTSGKVTTPLPRLLRSEVSGGVRTFSGQAAPEDVEVALANGERRNLSSLFPNPNDPFGINSALELGEGGLNLSVVVRSGVPSGDPWALNMVPFGVSLDGVLLDPSGPWFDGGAPDPRNPFDRACSGWEYDPLFPVVARLVGLPLEVRGHVQPGPGERPGSLGTFHYHGAPVRFLSRLRLALGEQSAPTIVGYAADGWPIIDAFLPGAPKVHLFSGWVLREGARRAHPHTNPALTPSGDHDGTFVQDWEYEPTRKRALIHAALDRQGEWNGLRREDLDAGKATFQLADAFNGVTLPSGWVYVLTPDWPEVPRWFVAEPSPSFRAIIPLDTPPGVSGPPTRRALYDACDATLADVHLWSGRRPY